MSEHSRKRQELLKKLNEKLELLEHNLSKTITATDELKEELLSLKKDFNNK